MKQHSCKRNYGIKRLTYETIAARGFKKSSKNSVLLNGSPVENSSRQTARGGKARTKPSMRIMCCGIEAVVYWARSKTRYISNEEIGTPRGFSGLCGFEGWTCPAGEASYIYRRAAEKRLQMGNFSYWFCLKADAFYGDIETIEAQNQFIGGNEEWVIEIRVEQP